MQGIYGDATANRYVAGTAVHWYDYLSGKIPGGDGGGGLAFDNLDAIHELAPSKFILNTEACTLTGLVQDWRVATLYMVDIVGDLNSWTNGWMYWNSALLTGSKYPWAYGGPNHDNTTTFGDPVLFEYNATGEQRLIFQPSYYVLGHFSRFGRPGATVVAANGTGFAASAADYEAIRAYAQGKAKTANNLKLLATAFLSKDGTTIDLVVANANDSPATFTIADSAAGKEAAAAIPAKAVQTYSWTVQ